MRFSFFTLELAEHHPIIWLLEPTPPYMLHFKDRPSKPNPLYIGEGGHHFIRFGLQSDPVRTNRRLRDDVCMVIEFYVII